MCDSNSGVESEFRTEIVSQAAKAIVSLEPFFGATILVVDDTPESVRFLVDALRSEGMRVLIATSGGAAIDMLDDALPGLILMDALMPGMDGFAATRLIKADVRYAHLPVIFMSGISESNTVVRGLEAGGVDFVSKPIILDQLIARLRVHLRNARVAHGSQVALDFAGRPMIALDDECRASWSTPRGEAMLVNDFPEFAFDRTLPDHVRRALNQFQTSGGAAGTTTRFDLDDGWIEFTLVGHPSGDEWLFLISEAREGWEHRLLANQHALTSREAEVLLWISRGKPNRRISDILRISQRTVSKHLEQVFKKLGVRNRASAAAFAAETLSRRS
jgi:DNA-binding NarL/FixJ family response regulator